MKYRVEKGTIYLSEPIRNYKNGIKILFYRGYIDGRKRSDYPVAYTDTHKGQVEYELPDETIKVFELLYKTPRFRMCPYIWPKWEVAELSTVDYQAHSV